MRTSRISKESAKLAEALSARSPRITRNSSLQITPRPNRSSAVASADESDTSSSSLSSIAPPDIEDPVDFVPLKNKRKRGISITHAASSENGGAGRSVRSRKVIVKEEEEAKVKKRSVSRRLPARKSSAADGSVMEPPSSWEEIYNIVKDMRLRNPTAPVDTMGCAELYWRSSSPRDRRFHTLIALMLSSQTKDTVTAVAMQRLHTELVSSPINGNDNGDVKTLPIWDHAQQKGPSTLTLENILAVEPSRLNELIGTVGFHNNKTKYIKAAAEILRDEFNSDIPSTPEGLMRLPGVGPKMAYLCMSAAWDKHEGIGVDVHVHRITNLWGWHKTKTPEETRKALESWLPKDKWHEINKLLVGLGQTVCLPVGRRCGECDLAGTGLCKSEVKGQASKRRVKAKVEAQAEDEGPMVKVEFKEEPE